MDIKKAVESLCCRFDTREPFILAKQKGIIIRYEPLGAIRGFYNKCYRQKFIHINNELPEHHRRMVCGHELGHALMHADANTPFLREYTLFSVSKLENEANQFMVHLLYPDIIFREYINFTIPQVAQLLGLDEDLVKYKFSTLGIKIEVGENENYQ